MIQAGKHPRRQHPQVIAVQLQRLNPIQSGKIAGLQVGQHLIRQIQFRQGGQVLRRDIGTIQDTGQLHEHVLDLFRHAADVGCPQTQRVCLQRQTGDQPPAVGEFLSDAHEFQVVQSHVGRVPGNGKRLAHHPACRDHDPAGLRSPAPCTGRPRHAHGERRTLRKAHAHFDPPDF